MNMENNSGKYMYTDLIISDCRGRTVVGGLSWEDCRGSRGRTVVGGLSWEDCRGRTVVGGQVFPGNGIESFHKSSVQMIIEFYPKVHRRNNY
jgi:hypothetical protein